MNNNEVEDAIVFLFCVVLPGLVFITSIVATLAAFRMGWL